MQKSVKKAGCHSIGATIRTRRESWCLLYAELVFLNTVTAKMLKAGHLNILQNVTC